MNDRRDLVTAAYLLALAVLILALAGCASVAPAFCTVRMALVCGDDGCEYVPDRTDCPSLTWDGRIVPTTCEECATDSECEALCPAEE